MKRVEPVHSFDDLAAPLHVAVGLRRLCQSYRRSREQSGAVGPGLVSLFVGEPGSGRHHAAEAVATELRLDLYQIDSTRVVDKYIGETEKNLERVLDAAENAGEGVLLFEEADALFGQRYEVDDSRGRYANLDLESLLTRLEAYQGLTILTPSPRQNIEDAILRRIRVIVNFSVP